MKTGTHRVKYPSAFRINRINMPSSVIAHIKYHLESNKLIVVFLSGDVYAYKDVPEKIYKEFKAAVSKGNYLNRKIKKLFKAEKIS